jgi:hypothetical protein
MIRLNLFTAAKTVGGISQQQELPGAAWHISLESGGKSPAFLPAERFIVARLLPIYN